MPISFAIFLETDYEIQKMMKSTQSLLFQKKNLKFFFSGSWKYLSLTIKSPKKQINYFKNYLILILKTKIGSLFLCFFGLPFEYFI